MTCYKVLQNTPILGIYEGVIYTKVFQIHQKKEKSQCRRELFHCQI
jgi:hypothetical protein